MIGPLPLAPRQHRHPSHERTAADACHADFCHADACQCPGLHTMPLLHIPVPEGDDALEPLDVAAWTDLAATQLYTQIDFDMVGEGDVFALLDRRTLDAPFARRVFVLVLDDATCAVYDEQGVLLDEPDNGTPLGVQAFRRGEADNQASFEAECDVDGMQYYSVQIYMDPAVGGGGEDDKLAAAVDSEEEVEEEVEQTDTPMADPAVLQTEVKRLKFVQGARLLLAHSDTPADPLSLQTSATVGLVVQKADPQESQALVVWDDKRHERFQLTDEFIRSIHPDAFISDEDDVASTDRAVHLMLARCQKAAEGYFYGTGELGKDDCFLAPSSYEAVPCATKDVRYPVSFGVGAHVHYLQEPTVYTLISFLVSSEPGQVRFYALLGDERALEISETLRPRYAVVQLVDGNRDAVLTVQQDGNQASAGGAYCGPDACPRARAFGSLRPQR